ncbi:MAG: IclR family transcriptional regulator [Candidatus Dormibacteria bacterium]
MARLLSRQRNPLGRTVRLLGWMADRGAEDYGVRELAGAVAMAPSTVHRSLAALEEEGLVDSLPSSGRYRLSLGFYRLALRGAARAPLVEQALPSLRRVASTSGETTLLALYGEPQIAILYAAEVPSRHALQVRPALHQWTPLTGSAAGLAVLAVLAEKAVVAAFGKARTGLSASDLASRLAKVRESGFASSPGEPGSPWKEVAAAFATAGGRPLGALSVALPGQRADPVLEATLGQLLVKEAAELAKQL